MSIKEVFHIPNVMTHGLMALDVAGALSNSLVAMAIDKYPHAFLLGSNGPDIFFYNNVFPWEDSTMNEEFTAIGQAVHTNKVNEFYNKSLEFIRNTPNEDRKEILTAYVAGHFMHWVLDTKAHPFVFYRSGPLEGESKYWHYRYESMLDALVITYGKGLRLQDFSAKNFVDVSAKERRVISSYYATILSQVFDIEVEPEEIQKSMISMKKALGYLYDPYNVKMPMIQSLEKQIGEPWQLSSHVVSSKIESYPDILNLSKETWANPTDINDVSNDSFLDIYEDSVKEGIYILNAFNEALLGHRSVFDDLLQDRQYDTGRNTELEMKYFDPVYESEGE